MRYSSRAVLAGLAGARRVLAVVAVVEILALIAPVATWSPISKADLGLALLLASLSMTYSLFVFGWEKARRLLLLQRTPAITTERLIDMVLRGSNPPPAGDSGCGYRGVGGRRMAGIQLGRFQ